MKSSQSKSTSSSQSTGGASESSSTAGRSRDESSSIGSAAHGSESYGTGAGGDTSLTSASSVQGRDEFSNIRSQSEQGAYADERDVNARNQQASQSSPYSQSHYGQAQGQAQSPYGQQQDYSSYGASQPQQRQPQSQATFRRRSQQQQQQPNQFDQQSALAQRPSDLVAQSGLDAVMDAWAGLVLGQVQIATQAAIRMAQCWFSPSLLSGITEVQRRYAEDSIASATAAASRLVQFTPRAINQNQPFFVQGSQQHVQNAPYGQQGAQEHQAPYNQQQDQQNQHGQQSSYGQNYGSRQQQYA